MRHLWQPRAAFVATCHRGHSPPHEGCSCGVYALRDAQHAAQYIALGGRIALGCVALSGRVVECERGWRASQAYPRLILVPARTEAGDLSPDLDDVLAALSVYSVPVLPLVGRISWEPFASAGDGLFPEAA